MSPELENFLYLAILPTASAVWLLVAGWHIKLLVFMVKSISHLATRTELHDHRLAQLEAANQPNHRTAKG